MPAQRLPWFRFWMGATAHGKVRTLDDGTFRTWVELLDAASQQPRRGRFASRAEAAAITRRPAKHVAALIAATLIDETPEGLTMHDWDDWQRWRKEDTNDTGIPPEQPPNDHRNGHTNDTRTTTESTHDDPASLREKKKEKRDRELDVDVELEKSEELSPHPANAGPPRGNSRVQALVDAFRERGIEPMLGPRDYAAVKRSTAPPGLVAEAYDAVARREYGDDFMRKRLSVHEAVDWVSGYVESRLEAAYARGDPEYEFEKSRLRGLGWLEPSAARGA